LKQFTSSIVGLRSIEMVVFDFDGVFTDNFVYLREDGKESVRCSRADGIGLGLLRAHGIKLFIISTEINKVVSARGRKLGIQVIQGVDDKAYVIEKLAGDCSVKLKNTVFLGNDRNDIPALQLVGYPVLVSDYESALEGFDFYRVERKGGNGAVRELCEVINDAMKQE
jgi:3-deoxy-D-manno-octulosonate 8-phosphate phosphatase (KDO 8-P phosphatase)